MLNTFYRTLAALCLLILRAHAVTDIIPSLFQWKFADGTLPTSLPTCTPLGIIVNLDSGVATNVTIGVPPYYMISFAAGSTPVTQFIGDDQNNLQWTVIQPVGSLLLLSVVDSNGNAGGNSLQLITVTPGQTTECVSTPSNTQEFTISSNVTGNLNTCSPWGLTISGGSPPYVVTLVETAQAVVTNVTVPFGDNTFTYINRAVPGGQMIAGVSDVTGQWASGTPVVDSVGSNDTDCTINIASSFGNEQDPQLTPANSSTSIPSTTSESVTSTSTTTPANTASANAASVTTVAANAHSTLVHLPEIVTAIVAVAVTLVLGIIASLVAWTLIKWRRQKQLELAATLPTQFSASSEHTGRFTGRFTAFSSKSERRNVEPPPDREYRPASRDAGGPSTSGPMANSFIAEQENLTTSTNLTGVSGACVVGSPPSYRSFHPLNPRRQK